MVKLVILDLSIMENREKQGDLYHTSGMIFNFLLMLICAPINRRIELQLIFLFNFLEFVTFDMLASFL
jgi:hypothetical protein